MTCSSELVPFAMSTAVESARSASLEPSVAKRIFVGKILIPNLHSRLVLHTNCINDLKVREAWSCLLGSFPRIAVRQVWQVANARAENYIFGSHTPGVCAKVAWCEGF